MSALFACGFRPFFLAAGLSAAALIPLWIGVLYGWVSPPGAPIAWHAHELIFGYLAAVLGGFFLTAVPNWTKTEFVRGGRLAALLLLWLAGRAAVAIGAGWGSPLAALIGSVDLAFLPALAWTIGGPIVRARSRRNLAFPLLLMSLAGANLALHLQAAGAIAPGAVPLRIAVYSVLTIIVIFGGRITPLFTRKALQIQGRPRGRLDDWAIGCTAILIPIWLLPPGPTARVITGAACATAAILNAIRLHGWGGSATLRAPILWVLHLGYTWVAVGLGLEAFAQLWPALLAPPVALHALTVGALGTFTLGMMTRVGRGHTGRALRVPAPIAVAYLALTAAALTRVLVPWIDPTLSRLAWTVSGAAWSIAFALYLLTDAPLLLRPRPDGRPG